MRKHLSKSIFGLWIPVLAFLAAYPALHGCAADRLQETGERTVVVIDPGHGGDNRGTIENNHEEKYMNMITAQAMYEELCLYDDVEVYLTRTADTDLTLEKRAAFAKEKDADFLFSLHFNASENHEMFGSEVWVSAFAPYNSYGYQFGHEVLSSLQEQGLLIRGIKTRLGSKGNDYYGIIRESVALEIPAVIIEHCYVDEERDDGYCNTEEALRALGRTDATAVAKYLGLKSTSLQVDYSGFQLAEADESSVQPATRNDATPPEICELSFVSADYERGILSLNVCAADYDSTLIYYDYSLDGGITFSRREEWPQTDALAGYYPDSFTLNLQIPSGVKPEVVVRAYNQYDLYGESNCYQSPEVFQSAASETLTAAMDSSAVPSGEGVSASTQETASSKEVIQYVADSGVEEGEVSFLTFLKLCLVIVIFLFVLLLVSQTIAYRKRRRLRLQRRKDAGERRNQSR